MDESKLKLHELKRERLPSKVAAVPIQTGGRRLFGLCATAMTFATIMAIAPCYGDAVPAAAVADSAAANVPQLAASVDSHSMSCKELKNRLASSGSLTILSGTKGWGDTFYGPRAPRCQFWTRPLFTYVNTRDGLCGVGYICVDKLGAGGGGGGGM